MRKRYTAEGRQDSEGTELGDQEEHWNRENMGKIEK